VSRSLFSRNEGVSGSNPLVGSQETAAICGSLVPRGRCDAVPAPPLEAFWKRSPSGRKKFMDANAASEHA
jgi:hypothetical protein